MSFRVIFASPCAQNHLETVPFCTLPDPLSPKGLVSPKIVSSLWLIDTATDYRIRFACLFLDQSMMIAINVQVSSPSNPGFTYAVAR